MLNEYIPGTYVKWSEYKCRHCGSLPPGFYPGFYYVDDSGKQRISLEYETLFKVFGQLRDNIGRPLLITSGYRCLNYEKRLYNEALEEGSTDKKALISAHLFGLALDIKCNSFEEQRKMVRICRTLTPKPRIGWKVYASRGEKIIHIDLAFMVSPPYDYLEEGEEW